MIMGINTSLEHEGKQYHIQCEDLGETRNCFEIRVYNQGSILWQKRVPYAAELPSDQAEKDEALKTQMAKLVKTVRAAIAQGKITGN